MLTKYLLNEKHLLLGEEPMKDPGSGSSEWALADEWAVQPPEVPSALCVSCTGREEEMG